MTADIIPLHRPGQTVIVAFPPAELRDMLVARAELAGHACIYCGRVVVVDRVALRQGTVYAALSSGIEVLAANLVRVR